MHTHLSETTPPHSTPSPFLAPALFQSPSQYMQLGFVSLASYPHVQQHTFTQVDPNTLGGGLVGTWPLYISRKLAPLGAGTVLVASQVQTLLAQGCLSTWASQQTVRTRGEG